jgi:glycosyltransferase involved in cell wall biosynthesis
MMMPPLVSILLPVRDGAATLPAALASLRAQTFTDCELIAVDDHSRDATPELLASSSSFPYAYSHMAISVWEAGGLVAALQAGLDRARGRFIARMDADDVCHPDRLRLQVERLRAEPDLGVVGCRVAFGGDRQRQAGYARYVDWINRLLTHDEMALARFRESPLAHPSVMFRRELLERHGGYREGPFPEDYELWLRWFEAGVRFAKVPETLLTWNDPPDRLSRRHPNYALANFYAVKAEYLARWLVAHNPHHPDIVVVGAGRITRRRVEVLMAQGVRVRAWADLDPRKIGQRHHDAPVIHHDDLPLPGRAFIVPFVGAIGAAEHIRALLASRGYVAGRDYIEAA